MSKRLALLLAIGLVCSTAQARQRFWNYCGRGGQKVTVQGLKSTEVFQRTYPSCTIHVYTAGTVATVPLYSDNLMPNATTWGNPFTANADGYFEFYAGGGRYDVLETYLDTTVNPPVTVNVTWGDVLLCDPFGPHEDTGCATGGLTGPHDLLSPTHLDTDPYTPPDIGDIVRGSLNQLWQHLVIGQVGQVLTVVPAGLNAMPVWAWPSTLDTCTSVQVSGVEAGCEHEINFIPGINISSITAVDNSGAGSNDVTINASGGGAAAACDPAKIVNLYVDPAGNDTTGDGTIGNPWATIQHAWDVGVPGIVDGQYFINLKSPGEYIGPALGFLMASTRLSGKLFMGGGYDFTNCELPYAPCSQVTILGSVVNTSGYLISGIAGANVSADPVMLVDGAENVTFRGVTITKGTEAMLVMNGARVTLGGVSFLNNNKSLAVTAGGQVFVEPVTYVNDCTDAYPHCDSLRFDNDGTVTFPGGTADTALRSGPGGVYTDVCSTIKYDVGTYISTYDNNGAGLNLFYGGLFNDAGTMFFRGTLDIFGIQAPGGGGIYSEGETVVDIAKLKIDGGTDGITGLKYGVSSSGSFLSGATWEASGPDWTFKNLQRGILTTAYGGHIQLPAMTNVSIPYKGHVATGPVTIAGNSHPLPINGLFSKGAYGTGMLDHQILFNTYAGNYFVANLTLDNTQISLPMLSEGQHVTLVLRQDITGNHNISDWANVIGAEQPGVTGDTCSMQSFVYYHASGRWWAMGPMLKNQTCAALP